MQQMRFCKQGLDIVSKNIQAGYGIFKKLSCYKAA